MHTPGALRLGVEHDIQGFVQIRPRVHKGVTYSLVVLEHRHGGLFGHGPYQAFASARNKHVHIFVHFAQGGHGGVIRERNKLHGVGGQARRGQGLPQKLGQGPVGTRRLGTAAQYDRVARF